MISGNEMLVKSSHPRKLSPGDDGILNNVGPRKKN